MPSYLANSPFYFAGDRPRMVSQESVRTPCLVIFCSFCVYSLVPGVWHPVLVECPLFRRIVPAVCHDKHIKRYLLSCFVCKVCNDASCLHSISHFLRLDVFCRGLTPSSSQNFLLGSGTQVSQSGPEYSDNSCFSCMLTFWTYLMRCTYP